MTVLPTLPLFAELIFYLFGNGTATTNLVYVWPDTAWRFDFNYPPLALFSFFWTNLTYLPAFFLTHGRLIFVALAPHLYRWAGSGPFILMLVYSYEFAESHSPNMVDYTITQIVFKGNFLLTNPLNRYHPLLLHYSILSTNIIFLYLLLRDNDNFNTCTTPFSRSLNFSSLATMSSTTAALFLGAWWALQEGTWGGWWNWDPSEMFGLLYLVYHLRHYHTHYSYAISTKNSQKQLLWFSYLHATYFFLQLNFQTSTHNFGLQFFFFFNTNLFLFLTFLFCVGLAAWMTAQHLVLQTHYNLHTLPLYGLEKVQHLHLYLLLTGLILLVFFQTFRPSLSRLLLFYTLVEYLSFEFTFNTLSLWALTPFFFRFGLKESRAWFLYFYLQKMNTNQFLELLAPSTSYRFLSVLHQGLALFALLNYHSIAGVYTLLSSTPPWLETWVGYPVLYGGGLNYRLDGELLTKTNYLDLGITPLSTFTQHYWLAGQLGLDNQFGLILTNRTLTIVSYLLPPTRGLEFALLYPDTGTLIGLFLATLLFTGYSICY